MTTHTRILEFPHSRSLVNACVDELREEAHGSRRKLIIDFHALSLFGPPELILLNGQPHEHLRGEYVPRCLRFHGLRWIKCSGIFTHLEDVPPDSELRQLEGMLCWRNPGDVENCLLLDHADSNSGLLFSARGCTLEEHTGTVEAVELTRAWSPPPLLPARLIPKPVKLHQRFGGDPISIHLNDRAVQRQLFVGGMEHQSDQRPDIDAVLNLSEDENRWPLTAADRRAQKGEGPQGMGIAEIESEAQWVIERLQGGQRVLVHCSGGLNRSVTICCAVLMRLEALSAEDALTRVREHHPWARPDSHHWLKLRWLTYARML